jgi:hypothetical protein
VFPLAVEDQAMKWMRDILLRLFEELEKVGAEHEELYDTEVRDAMGSTVFSGFLKPEREETPTTTYLDDEAANQRVVEALKNYIDAANERASQLGLVKFKDRLAAFQDCSVITAEGNTTDDFFGYYNPAAYDDEGRFLWG